VEKITFEIDDKILTVYRNEYVTAKTKDLKEFGYQNITEQEVDRQLQKILNGDTDLSVIGQFMIDEIVI